ncbi:nuclear transport factor 2 family protein [Pseudomonas stutzeri]|uniref:nuclear transport factor 2 family protein n=1 Tax=Stutzerimonas stutzeri TaxID=316 RepID=UPI001F517C10|nr:nuclear transport factor 2 family protein [Stutzerimonas stutzeri]MCI0916265.1 nuclear transport factor 2 family protein [Stutzerimonas stutzeri]
MNEVQQVVQLEQQRQQALMNEDYVSIERLFADDLVYVHTTGMVQNKAQYLEYARNAVRYLEVQRGELQVQMLSEGVLLMTGPQCNVLQKRAGGEPVRAEGFASQVWAKRAQGWQIVLFHGTRSIA